MIRFSAGLVVVAIGVLIGGVATSKLSLVYVAIAVSAVALVVLAIGVALKRDELFGGGPELAPAGAGAGSGMPVDQSADPGHADVGDGHVREDQEKVHRRVPGPATAAFEAAAAASAAAASAAASSVAAPTVAVPPATVPPVTAPPIGSPVGSRTLGNPSLGDPPLGQRRPAFSQASTREADSAADWQTRSPQPPLPSGDQGRPIWTPQEPASQASQAPLAKETPSGGAGTTSASPRPWEGPEQPPTIPASASAARAGSAAASPSWFDKLNKPVADSAAGTAADSLESEPSAAAPTVAAPSAAAPTAAAPTAAAPTAAAPTVAAPTVAAPTVGVSDPGAADDDDWPTRYSWLEDDETDEAAEVGKPADTAEASDVTDVAETVPDEATAVEPAAAEADSPDAESPDADAEAHVATTDDVETAADPAGETDETAEPLAADAAHEDEADDADADADEPSAAQRSDSKLVTVIPGVPRYHDPDCILIRFMDEEDIARKSIPEAKAANCTPCAACQPEG